MKNSSHISIDELNLSVRASKALKEENIITIGDLEELMENSRRYVIRKIPNFGNHSYREVVIKLHNFFSEEKGKYINLNKKLDLLCKNLDIQVVRLDETTRNLKPYFESIIKLQLSSLNEELNGLRTVMLEMYRVIQSIQGESQPDAILRKINEKVPGFQSAIYDIYKKLENQ